MTTSCTLLFIAIFMQPPSTGPAPLDPQEREALAVLRKHGLARAGEAYCLLQAERDLSSLIKKIDAADAKVRKLQRQQPAPAAVKSAGSDVSDQIRLMKDELLRLNKQLATVKNTLENNRLVGRINELKLRIEELEDQAPAERRRQERDLEEQQLKLEKHRQTINETRQEYIECVERARRLAHELDEQYAAVVKIDEVAEAVSFLNGHQGRTLKVGPSSRYGRLVQRVEALVKTIESDVITLRRERGVWWVDAVVNGEHAVGMVFDTGAALVTISESLAARIGAAVVSQAPDIKLENASGGITRARQGLIKSIRIGRSIASDVPCAITPDSNSGVPLLGQSFLANFSCRLDAATGNLSLQSVADPVMQEEPARKKRRQ